MKELLTIRFKGRMRRREYWLSISGVTMLFYVVMGSLFEAVAFLAITMKLTTVSGIPDIPILITLVLWAPPFIYGFLLHLGYGARRLHDIGMSGWCQLLLLIPGIGGIALIVMFCMDSQRGTNRWGENPKEVEFEITRLAAEQGYAAAQSRLALYYETGMGVERDEVEAKKWHQKVAEH